MKRDNSVTEAENKKCAELWAEYESDLRNICKAKMHGYEAEIDDIIAEVYLALCNHTSKEGPPIYEKAWLYGTLKNLINQNFRDKYKKEENMAGFSIDQIDLPYQHDFVNDIVDNSAIEKLNTAISELDKKEQTVIKSVYFDDKRMKEIALKLGTTESAVKQKRYRICNKLRRILNEKQKK